MVSFQLHKMSASRPISSGEGAYHPPLQGLVGGQGGTQRRSVVGVRPVCGHVGGQPVLDYKSGRRRRYHGQKP